jgi:predicted TIM-barrel fold metal-dependent hydrolase
MAELAKKIEDLGFDYGVVCSSGLALGEETLTLDDAKANMGRIARAQNNTGAASVAEINRQLKESAAPYGRLIPFAKADLFQPSLAQDVKSAAESGFAGIGEVIGIHGNGEALGRLFAAMDGTGLPVFIHCDYPVDSGDLKEVFSLAGRYASQQVIIGHLGGDFWIEAIDTAREMKNVWLDLSEVVNQVALQVAANTLPEKLVFGSDFPWDCPESMLERINRLTNSLQVKEGILGNNMQHILGIC